MFAFFVLFSSSKAIADVMLGRWTGGSVFSTSQKNFENLDFNITYRTIKNCLVSSYEGKEIAINLSFTDISGNITYDDHIYEFNFTQTSPPLISANIQLDDAIMHVSFSSHTSMKIVILYSDGNSETIILRKASEGAISQGWWFVIMSCVGVVFYQAYNLAQNYFARKQAAKIAAERKAQQKKDETDEKKDKDSKSTEEEEEKKEDKKESEEEADEHKDEKEEGKIKESSKDDGVTHRKGK